MYSQVADSTAADVDAAAAAAAAALPAWAALSPAQRARWLHKIADGIEARLEDFALAESKDQGKPVWLARAVDIPRAVHNFRFFAETVPYERDVSMTTHKDGLEFLNYTKHSPLGVVGLISPWNLPLYLLTWKIAPAMAFGCTCVCKPSEFTSMTAFMLSKLMVELDVPAGVVNMVMGTGPSVGAPMVDHPTIRGISFTGGPYAAQDITRRSAPLVKRLSLELGGKNANLIFADADMDKAVATSVRSAFANQGEICLCASRIYVERSAYDAFLAKYVPAVEALKVGPPSDPETKVGPLASKGHMEKVLSYIDIARQEGGTIAAGGQRVTSLGDGYYVAPTVVTDLPRESRLECEEIFGPVVIVVPFDTEEEAIARANAVHYGLAGVVWTQNLGRAHRVAAAIESGTVWVNTWMTRDTRVPFGGHKHSGIGIEGGPEHSREFFTNTKNICIAME